MVMLSRGLTIPTPTAILHYIHNVVCKAVVKIKINFNSIQPVYLQIAQAIEDDIITGKLQEGEAAYSQLTIARELGVNPATAAKGINQLVQKGILEKQRGLSMTVAAGAVQTLLRERRDGNFYSQIASLVREAQKIQLSREQVLAAIQSYYQTIEGDTTNA